MLMPGIEVQHADHMDGNLRKHKQHEQQDVRIGAENDRNDSTIEDDNYKKREDDNYKKRPNVCWWVSPLDYV